MTVARASDREEEVRADPPEEPSYGSHNEEDAKVTNGLTHPRLRYRRPIDIKTEPVIKHRHRYHTPHPT
jgi:hypothetical protein